MNIRKSDYMIVFDGGSIGNPGRGYGSYAITGPGGEQRITKLEFSGRVTSNEAEYDTLAAALEGLLAALRAAGDDPAATSVSVRGDSLLVINQLTGEWKARELRMQERRDRILALARHFKRVSYVHQPRARSVAVLGH
jgi:ribonuclease HI